MKELRHCSWVRGCGCPRRDTPPCLSPWTIPSSTLSLLSVGAGCRMRTRDHTRDIYAAQCPSPHAAPAEEPKDVLGLCDGETMDDGSLQAGARLGCVKAKESKDEPEPPHPAAQPLPPHVKQLYSPKRSGTQPPRQGLRLLSRCSNLQWGVGEPQTGFREAREWARGFELQHPAWERQELSDVWAPSPTL